MRKYLDTLAKIKTNKLDVSQPKWVHIALTCTLALVAPEYCFLGMWLNASMLMNGRLAHKYIDNISDYEQVRRKKKVRRHVWNSNTTSM